MRSDEYAGTGRSDQTPKAAPANPAMIATTVASHRKDCAAILAIASRPCRSGSSATTGDRLPERGRLPGPWAAGAFFLPRLAGLCLVDVIGGQDSAKPLRGQMTKRTSPRCPW